MNPSTHAVLPLADLGLAPLRALFGAHGLQIHCVEAHAPIPGSYWGEPEAGLIGDVLHVRDDTPVHSGFSHTSRLASHGCVRLEEPKQLAELLLASDPDWTSDRIAETVADDKTVRVPTPHPMPVFILYWTAFADPSGQVAFRTDAYDWDQKLIDLLAAEKDHA